MWLRWITNKWLKKKKCLTGTCFMELPVWEIFPELINACDLKISTLITSHLRIYLKPRFPLSRASYYIQHLSSDWQAHTFVTKARCQRWWEDCLFLWSEPSGSQKTNFIYAYVLRLAVPNKVLLFTEKSVYLFWYDSDTNKDWFYLHSYLLGYVVWRMMHRQWKIKGWIELTNFEGL